MLRKLVVVALVSLAAGAVHAGDDFDTLRGRWQARLAGAAELDRSDPAVSAQLSALAQSGRKAQDALTAGTGPILWADIADFNNPKGLLASAAVTSNARRIDQMALAWATPGSPLYHDAALGAAVSAGLGRFVQHHYRAGRPAYGNWWDWQIGTPQTVLDVLTLMDGALAPALKRRALDAVNWYVPDPRFKTRNDGSLDRKRLETGANLLDKALVAILSGMLDKDGARIALGRDAIGPSLDFVERGDGFYRDNSFIQHTYVPYTGNYGAVALSDYARLLSLLADSPWALRDPRVMRVFVWAREAYGALLVDGAMPDAVRGRKIAGRGQTDHSVGRGVVGTLAELADVAPPESRAALRGIVKGAMQRDHTYGTAYLGTPGGVGTSGLSLYDLGLLRQIAGDPATPAAPEPPGARLYPSMDRAILRGPGFAAVLSLTSPRTSSFEFGNGENLRAWWTGMGTLAVYDADQAQFDGPYWPTVDSSRLPGTTTDHSGSGRPIEWKQYPNPRSWVGGVSLDGFAALGMDFSMRDVTGSALQGKKSWFLLGDRIVALGADIGGGVGPSETIVENRRLSDAAGARLLVDGQPLANGTRQNARWAWLEDRQAGSHLGYLFPAGVELVSARTERSGSWRDLNEQGSNEVLHATYQSLAIPHGASTYAYVLLPNASEATTRAAAAAPGMQVEVNDAHAAAVSVPHDGLYATNLWEAGSAPRDGRAFVQASGPAAVLVRGGEGGWRIAVADPTQLQDTLEITLEQAVGSLQHADAGVTVLATAPQLRLRIATKGAAGSTFGATFGPAPR